MSQLDEIASAAAIRRADAAQAATTRAESQKSIAEAQHAALRRWHLEMRSAIANAADKISDALGGKATGDYLKWHSEHESQIVRNETSHGEQMSMTLRVVQGGQLRNFIKFSLEAVQGPDAAVFAITNDGKSVVRLVVDENFKSSAVEYWLTRIVHESVAIG